jgi:type IV secretion system protein VirB5
MWKRNQAAYGRTEAPVTPYQKAAQTWDDRIGSARVQAKNWRIIAILSLLFAIAMSAAFVWRSSQSIITPYVVELEQNGSVRAVAPSVAKYKPTDAQIGYQLAEFIKKVRSVSIDPVVLRQNWTTAYHFATDQAALTLNEYARDNDPFQDVGHRSVSVQIASVVRSSDDSFDLRWRETAFRDGVKLSTNTYTANLSIILKTPTDEQTLHQNPLGIYVHGINWSKDLIRGE